VYSLQVLKGESPFHGIPDSALAYYVVLRGKRPDKPENASAIGFSDSLWDFTQRCWDGKIELRPEVAEVVRYLGGAATKWNGFMPPHIQAKAAASNVGGTFGSMKCGEFNALIFLQHSPSSNGTDFVLVDPTYQLLWERFITIITKAKAFWAMAGIVTTSASEATLDSINYGMLGVPILP